MSDQMRAALEPFAKFGEGLYLDGGDNDDAMVFYAPLKCDLLLMLSDFRRAKVAYEALSQAPAEDQDLREEMMDCYQFGTVPAEDDGLLTKLAGLAELCGKMVAVCKALDEPEAADREKLVDQWTVDGTTAQAAIDEIVCLRAALASHRPDPGEKI